MYSIIRVDRELFKLINQTWQNSIFDQVFPLIRNSIFWIPLYLFLLLFLIINHKKNIFWWIIFAASTAILTDFVSSKLIKENIMRLRPCNDPTLADSMHFLLNYRPQSSSFTSSHAATHFALAVFFYLTLRNIIGRWALLFFLWAFLIVYAQVYVGVHFPLDVFCGAIIGTGIGYFTSCTFNKKHLLA